MSSYRDSLENYLKGLDVKTKRVLDVGGGANPVLKRVKSWDVKEVKYLDNEAEYMKIIIDYKLDINYEPTLEKKKEIGKYDMVFCLEVFEYVFDPIVALSNIAGFLVDGGEAVVTFPTLYPLHNPVGIDYLRYTVEGIMKLALECNLHVEEIIPRYPTQEGLELLQKFYESQGLHARKYTEDIYSLGYIVRLRK